LSDLGKLFAPDEGRDALRQLGGLLLGLGLMLAFVRKGTNAFGDTWGDWGLFAILLTAFVFLYGVGMLGAVSAGLRSWGSAYLVFGILVAPLALLQFIEAVNGAPGASLNIFWVFGVTAGLGVAASLVAGLRYGLLLASLAVIVSWSALWGKVLSNGIGAHYGVYRGLLLVLAVLLAGAAAAMATRRIEPDGPERASELVTGASLAAVIAGSLSAPKIFALSNPFFTIAGPSSSLLWEIVLLVVSLLAIGYGSRFSARGPAYVGALGLLIFVLIAGLDLNDSTPDGSLVGWPLFLMLAGALAFVASLLGASRSPGAGLASAPDRPDSGPEHPGPG
jgi:hypothetical protein